MASMKIVDHTVVPITKAENGTQRIAAVIIADVNGTPGELLTREMLGEAIREDMPSRKIHGSNLEFTRIYLDAIGYPVDERLLPNVD